MDKGGGSGEEVTLGPTKRQRRPSVKLHQPYYENPRRVKSMDRTIKKRVPVNPKNKKKSATDDENEGEEENQEMGVNLDDVAIGSWKNFRVLKSKARRKRVRPSSQWGSAKLVDNGGHNREFTLSSGGDGNGSEDLGGEEENLGGDVMGRSFRPVSTEHSSSIRSDENDNDDDGDKNSSDENGNVGVGSRLGVVPGSEGDRVGVGAWLRGLGLEKYKPLFEIHEVDDEVLPFLTLEDLKDMGVSAVGSRRKMYCSIQKLGKGFS